MQNAKYVRVVIWKRINIYRVMLVIGVIGEGAAVRITLYQLSRNM